MKKAEHITRHMQLHGMLDELIADFILKADGSISMPITKLVKWSFKQTTNPD